MQIKASPLVALQLQLLQRKNMADSPVPVYITTSSEWEYLRPIITKLYMDERWELPRVVKEIETKYGFKAT
jgi:Clr5 domain